MLKGYAMQRQGTSMVLIIASWVTLASCAGGGEPAATFPAANSKFPMTVSSCGQQVTIDHPPTRVLTVETDTSTALAAVGASNRIVARAGEGDSPLGGYADELSGIPQIGANDPDPPSREVVLSQRVDLVVAGHISLQWKQDLEAAGLQVLVPAWFCGAIQSDAGPADFTGIYRTLETYGQIFGTEDIARRTVTDLRNRVAKVEQQFRGIAPRTAADVYVATEQLYVYGGLSLNNTVLTTLGLTNVFADLKERTAEASTENLIARDPTVILLNYGSNYGITDGTDAIRAFNAIPPLDRLTAVREQRLLTLNYSYLVGGPLAVDGLEMLATQLAA
jgi:iron complex transport system substrate-binding protein